MLYLDSEGDAELHFRIREHLDMCPSCAEWFTQQQRLEQAFNERLASGEATPELWERVLSRSGVRPSAPARKSWYVWGSVLAATVLLTVAIALQVNRRLPPSDLAPLAADWHEQPVQGKLRPDFLSTSDEEVDRYLKKQVPFRVHCPPRTNVKFAVKGAGVCRLTPSSPPFDRGEHGGVAAYIVGQVDEAEVSIFVLDQASLDAFPHENAHLREGKHHRCREGDYQMVSAVIAGNVVVVIGRTPADALEKLLNAYGTYHHEG